VTVDTLETRAWAEKNRAAWEILPLVETTCGERRQLGYELDLYARIPTEIPPSAERQRKTAETWDRLREIAESLSGLGREGERVEVEPFDAGGRLRPENHFEPEVLLRARVVHPAEYLAPVGADERQHLGPMEERLRELGLRPGHW
jgi:hypothetical protein